jgi:hypothetical protein
VREYIEYLLKEISDKKPEAVNADQVADLLSVWVKAWDSEKISDIEKQMDKFEKSINERTNSFMEEAEELMEEVRSDLAGEDETH